MPTFFDRLANYYNSIGKTLKGSADEASIFPNTTDVGFYREMIYLEFLKNHCPRNCSVDLGGFLYDLEGRESKQMDIIISLNSSPVHKLEYKSFGPVDGCVGAVSIKSKLDKNQLYDALENIASIPPTSNYSKRIPNGLSLGHTSNWPFKIIYASDGNSAENILNHMYDFYKNNEVNIDRRPDIIHVAGKYFIRKMDGSSELTRVNGEKYVPMYGEMRGFVTEPDSEAITITINRIQKIANLASFICYDYDKITNSTYESIVKLFHNK